MPPAAAETLLVDAEWQYLAIRHILTGKTGAALSHDLWVRQKPCQAR